MTIFIFLFIAGLILTIGDIFQKEWILRNNYWLFSIGCILYTIGGIILTFCYKYKNMATATMIYSIFNILTLSLVSWFWYKEKLDIYSIIGILLGIISIAFLEYSGK